MLRKEYPQQKDKGTKYMELFTFLSGVEFLDLRWDRKSRYKVWGKRKENMFKRRNR